MADDILVPLIIFGSICSIVLLPIYWRGQLRRRVLETVKEMANTGTPMSPELIAGLMGPMAQTLPSRQRDLRNGYVLISLAVGIALIGIAAAVMGWNLGDSAQGVAIGSGVAAVGAIPLCVGAAFLMLAHGQKKD
jgi:hypothetical protein